MENSLLTFLTKFGQAHCTIYNVCTGSFDDINDDIKVIQSSYNVHVHVHNHYC